MVAAMLPGSANGWTVGGKRKGFSYLRSMSKKYAPPPAEDHSKHFSFSSAEKALQAFRQACQIVENKFFMDASTLVALQDRVVTVPEWFPFKARE